MSQLQTIPPGRSIVAKLAEMYGMEAAALEATLCETIFPSGGKATRAQVAALCIVAEQYDLNPFIKQVYAFPAKGGGIQPIISVDGWYKILNEHPQNDGFTCVVNRDEDGKIVSATATFWRKDRSQPFVWTEELDECYRDTQPWKGTTSRMLKHRALCQGTRICYAIPAYEPDEGERMVDFEIKASETPATKRSLDDLAVSLPAKAAEVAPKASAQPAPAQSATQAMADDGPWNADPLPVDGGGLPDFPAESELFPATAKSSKRSKGDPEA